MSSDTSLTDVTESQTTANPPRKRVREDDAPSKRRISLSEADMRQLHFATKNPDETPFDGRNRVKRTTTRSRAVKKDSVLSKRRESLSPGDIRELQLATKNPDETPFDGRNRVKRTTTRRRAVKKDIVLSERRESLSRGNMRELQLATKNLDETDSNTDGRNLPKRTASRSRPDKKLPHTSKDHHDETGSRYRSDSPSVRSVVISRCGSIRLVDNTKQYGAGVNNISFIPESLPGDVGELNEHTPANTVEYGSTQRDNLTNWKRIRRLCCCCCCCFRN